LVDSEMGISASYLRGAASIGLGNTANHLRRTTSAAAGNGLGTTIDYLRRTASCAAGYGLGATIE
jgi:hypothetical protein